MQIYADRMEGKAAQSVTVAGDADNPLTSVLDASKLTSEQLAIIAAIKISKSE
jgi:Na+-transporting methylmalonyl-CoA/oxaloacetate decarboxylase beta subunit